MADTHELSGRTLDYDDDSLTDLTQALRWSRHDRTHLEVSINYRGVDATSNDSQVWEAYFFIPESFHLNAETYRKRQVFADLRSYVRLTVPPLDLGSAAQEANRLAEDVPSLDPDQAVDELKLFGSRLQRSIVDAADLVEADIDSSKPSDSEPVVREFVDNANRVAREVRRSLFALIDDHGLTDEVVQSATWIDEYLSRSLEKSFVRLARSETSPSGGPPAGPATDAALGEARYRQLAESGPVSSAEGSATELERVERRQHSLKRFTSSVLWLDVDIRDANPWAEHVLHAVAAGIAMAFAVAAALLLGNNSEGGRLWVWGLLVVLAYMAKDRIKVMLQRVFDAVMADHLPDRRWTVRHPERQPMLATVVEKASFCGRDDVPDEVHAIRGEAFRDTLQEMAAPESVLHHRKEIRLRPEAIAGVDPRFSALTEVVRMDVSSWLTHTDDAKRSVTMADPELEQLFTSKLPRAYDVIAVYRLRGHPGVGDAWQSARFVVGRSGIRRISALT